MRTLAFTCALVALALLPAVEFAQEKPEAEPSPSKAVTNEELEQLWKTGCLWQVGDNIKKVDEARKAIVEAGDAGLAFILTKLGESGGLEFRCLEAVFKGFGAKAIKGLLERSNDKELFVRRNVAAMLGVIDDKSAAPGMLEQFKREQDIRVKVPILQALAKWKIPEALDPLIETTKTDNERARMRVVSLLARYDDERAVARLKELLDDPAYFIRDAARDALKASVVFAVERRATEAAAMLGVKQPSEGQLTRLRCLLATIVEPENQKARLTIMKALGHEDARVRGDAALLARDMAFKEIKLAHHAGHEVETLDWYLTTSALARQAAVETDPYAAACQDKVFADFGVKRREYVK